MSAGNPLRHARLMPTTGSTHQWVRHSALVTSCTPILTLSELYLSIFQPWAESKGSLASISTYCQVWWRGFYTRKDSGCWNIYFLLIPDGQCVPKRKWSTFLGFWKRYQGLLTENKLIHNPFTSVDMCILHLWSTCCHHPHLHVG